MQGLIGQVSWMTFPVIVSGILHMFVVKLDWFSSLKIPLDGGRSWRGKRILGDNKTWRGVLFMIFASAGFGGLQGALGGGWAHTSGVEAIDFVDLAGSLGLGTDPASFTVAYGLLGAVLGFGYALGELPNSFVKRQIDIAPGTTDAGLAGRLFFVIDQADSPVVGLLVGAIAFGYGWRVTVMGSVCLTLLHLLLNAALYASRVRKNL